MGAKSRERVLKAIEFGCPDRIPLFKGPDADIAGVGFAPAASLTPGEPGMDEWGCVRTSLNREAGAPDSHERMERNRCQRVIQQYPSRR